MLSDMTETKLGIWVLLLSAAGFLYKCHLVFILTGILQNTIALSFKPAISLTVQRSLLVSPAFSIQSYIKNIRARCTLSGTR